MNMLIIKLINLILAGLISGAMFGIWAGYNPKGISTQTYIEQQQEVIKALNQLMPIMGMITIIMTLLAAFAQKEDHAVFAVLLFATGFLIISGLITKFGDQPINRIIMTLDKFSPPTVLGTLRDKWWTLHTVRMLSTVIAFCLIAWSNVQSV